jgi:hypothetical protein
MAQAARLTAEAGIEFWYTFQVLMLPPVEHVRVVRPDLFNAQGEPDMDGEAIYDLLRAQIAELVEIAPNLRGLELWVMECARVVISHLRHQRTPLAGICERIVDTVHLETSRRGLMLALDLHTAGGHGPTRQALLAAARRRPDVIVGGDNVVGDFHPHLPFNEHLRRAARTNPIQVHFDVNGEYWGRNFVPTCALSQYARHIEEARDLGAVYLDGRVSTGHDCWSPHDNALPSRRHHYPALERVEQGKPLPADVELCCFDTLGGFNAEFFCQRAKDPGVAPGDVLREFLREEFGAPAEPLAQVLTDVEDVAGRLFFADKNYFGAQSVLPTPGLFDFHALDVQLTTPAGHAFPPAGGLSQAGVFGGRRADFSGWPVPAGHRAAGAESMIAEKRCALEAARALLRRAEEAAAGLAPRDRQFVVRQFEDLAFLARAAALLMEAMAHLAHQRMGTACALCPDPRRLAELYRAMADLVGEWERRYPDGRWLLAGRLREWLGVMGNGTPR